jgi:preprotein translocase subunit SecE
VARNNRNRKRRNDRRPRRPADDDRSRPGLATARAQRDETPDPLTHATPDVELAEAQLALGRPELGSPGDAQPDDIADGDDDGDLGDDGVSSVGAGLTPSGGSAPALRGGSRLLHFLQGSWRELQRVQWPDRRQVMQATGVVIGFVIVAGVFLGLADFVAGKVVTLILK